MIAVSIFLLMAIIAMFLFGEKKPKNKETITIKAQSEWKYSYFRHLRLSNKYLDGVHQYSQITGSFDGETWDNSVKVQNGRPNYTNLDGNKMSEERAQKMYDELLTMSEN